MSPIQYTYDADGHLLGLTQGTRSWQYAYDGNGRLATATDPLSRSTQYFYDDADRLTREVFPNGAETAFGYDANGNLASVTPPGRSAHTFEYNNVDLTTRYAPPAVDAADPSTFFSYDDDRAVSRIVRPDGHRLHS